MNKFKGLSRTPDFVSGFSKTCDGLITTLDWLQFTWEFVKLIATDAWTPIKANNAFVYATEQFFS